MNRNYVFVPENEYAPEKKRIESILMKVHELVEPYFKFSHTYVGSTDRGLITRDKNNCTGYDFDVNIHVNAKAKKYSPEEIKKIMMAAVDSCSHEYGYSKCEDSKRVFTISKQIHINSKETVSCDFAIVNDWSKDQQWIILHDFNQNTYKWDKLPQSDKELERRADQIKQDGRWDEVRELYICKKNTDGNPNNKSRSLYAATINEIF